MSCGIGIIRGSSIFFRHLLVSSAYSTAPIRNVHRVLFLCCKQGDARGTLSSVPLTSSYSPSTSPSSTADSNIDILTEQLKRAESLQRVLDIAQQHNSIMNARQLALTFEMIYEVLKMRKKDFQTLLRDETFEELCNRAQKCARFFDLEHTLTIFRTLTFLGVSAETSLMQMLLQMLRRGINDLSLDQLTFLNFLLTKHQSTPIVEALKIALPLVLQAQIDVQLDPNNVSQVVWCMATAARHQLKEECLAKLVKAAHQSKSSLTVRLAVMLVQSLLHIKEPVAGHNELLNYAFDFLTSNIDQLKRSELISLFYVLHLRGGFFHRNFFKAVALRMASSNTDVSQMLLVAECFASSEYVDEDLLENLAKLMCNSEEKVNVDKRISVLTAARLFALTGYQPSNSAKLWNILANSPKLDHFKKNNEHLLVEFASCLAILEVYPKQLLVEILDSNYLMSVINQSYGKDCLSKTLNDIRLLSIGLTSEAAKYDGPYVPSNIFNEAMTDTLNRIRRERGYPLQTYLESALGGSAFVLSEMLTKQGHFIDHAIVIRKGQYPVAVNLPKDDLPSNTSDPLKFIEDVEVPPDSKIIAILVLAPSDYCRETSQPKGSTILCQRSLRKLGYYPITVNLENWNIMLDREKIPYLMREIRNVCQSEERVPGYE